MAKPRAGAKPKGPAAGDGSVVTFGRGSLGQAANHVSERFQNAKGMFLGRPKGRGGGTPGVAGDSLDALARDFDLSNIDLDDDLEAIALAQRPLAAQGGGVAPLPAVNALSAADDPDPEPGPLFSPDSPDAGDTGDWGDSGEGGEGRGDGPSGKNGIRVSRTAVLGIVIAALLVVVIWGGLSTLSPPDGDEVAPEPSAGPAEEVVATPMGPEAPPRLSPGSLASESEWRDNLVVDVYQVQSGGTLSAALEKLSLTQDQRRSLYQVLENKELIRQVMPGEEFSAWWATPERKPEDLERLEYLAVGAVRPLIFLPGGPEGFYVVDLGSPSMMIHQAAQGTVDATFWEAADKAGLEPWVIMRIVDLLASQIDFVSDIRTGDSFQILFQGEYQDGRLASRPIIEMIRFINKDERYEFYRHVTKEGVEGYYDAQFRSIKKNFFKSPLQYSRISSVFTKARFHPILKIVRPHLGVDYAAPTGTPVSAVADGVVNYAGWRGGYGRLVILEHPGDIITMYGHLSVIAKGISKGVKVSQGDLIGNVGATGLATGPHLDFRLRRKGEFVDPETVLAEQQGQPMPQEDRLDFAEKVNGDQDLLKQLLEVN
ncbi:MAG: M23 family metallopeptidase [Deltaproteobacteria bacterium]|nr:M23 family metallopeptidase [Deltaproteobacteria bacterium]